MKKYVIGAVVAVAVLAVAGLAGPSLMRMTGGDTWLDHGFTKQQRRQIGRHLATCDKVGENGGVAGGAFALYHRGDLVFKKAFGQSNRDKGTEFTTRDPVRLASASKPITATVIMMLHDRGYLDVDEPISTYLEEFQGVRLRGKGKAKRAPTVREMLTHMGGLPANRDVDDDRRASLFSSGTETLVRATTRFGLAYEPGEDEIYSGVGFIIAARAAEVVMGGRDFEQIMKEVLLDPLGMTSTTFRATEDIVARMPVLYSLQEGTFVAEADLPVEGGDSPINPAGGLLSNLDDMALFYGLHANQGIHEGKRYMGAEALADMYVAHSRSGEHGLGFNVEFTNDGEHTGRVMHGGKSGVYAWLDFENELVGILLAQTDTTGNRDFRFKLVDMVTEFTEGLGGGGEDDAEPAAPADEATAEGPEGKRRRRKN